LARVGIDYTAAHEQGGGIGRYVRELAEALFRLEEAQQHEYALFVAGAIRSQLPQLATHAGLTYEWRATPLTNRWLARLWHRSHIPVPIESITGSVDLFHATDFVLPPTRQTTRTILTVHDLSFIHTPETASPRLRQYLNRVVPRSVQKADFILADSEATQRDVIAYYGVAESKIDVLLSGVNPRFAPVTDIARLEHIRNKYGIGERPFIFTVGTIQPRKNYGRLIEALAHIRAHGHDLSVVIAGGRGWLEDDIYGAIETHDMEPYVQFIGYADDTDLPALYSSAGAVWFVSLYEGFGLPVLEAMACGAPVITSNVSSLPEVAGDAAIKVSPTDLSAICDGMLGLLEDDELRNRLISRGFERAAQFTWEKAASKLLTTYNRVLNA